MNGIRNEEHRNSRPTEKNKERMVDSQFFSRLDRLGIRLWVDEGRLRYEAPEGAMTAALRAELSEQKAAILDYLQKSRAASASGELSFTERRSWYVAKLIATPLDNSLSALRLSGPLDPALMEQAVLRVMQRHENLRTAFPESEGLPIREVRSLPDFRLELADLSALPEQRREGEARALVLATARLSFDLSVPALFRIKLIRLSQEDHVLVLVVHHIVSDGWSSLRVLVPELASIYGALVSGRPGLLDDAARPFSEYALRQRQWRRSGLWDRPLAEAAEILKSQLRPFRLPLDHPRPKLRGHRGARQHFLHSVERLDALRALARQEDVTLYTIVLTAFHCVLFHFSGEERTHVLTPVAARPLPDWQDTIGYFSNDLVLTASFEGHPTLRAFLHAQQETVLSGLARESLPLEAVLEASGLLDRFGYDELFPVAFVMRPSSVGTMNLPEGLSIVPFPVDDGLSRRDLDFVFSETQAGLSGFFEFDADLFEASTIGALSGALEQFLASMVMHLDRPVAEIDLGQDWPATSAFRPPASDGEISSGPDARSLAYQAAARERPPTLDECRGRLASPLGSTAAFIPISYSQELSWLEDRRIPGTPMNNLFRAMRLKGVLSVPRLEAGLEEIARRHAILRTSFHLEAAGPGQRVADSITIPLQQIDLSALHRGESEREVSKWIALESLHSFDLSRAPLARFVLLRLARDEHVLLLSIHHIVSDGLSLEILLKELLLVDRLLAEGLPGRLPELPLQYADFALWQRRSFPSERYAKDIAYWEKKLSGAPEVLELPGDHPRPAEQSFQGARVALCLPPPLAEGVRKLAREKGCTPFMVLLAAFQSLLARFSGLEDVVVGTPVLGRELPGTEALIGFLANNLVIRTDFSGRPTFPEILRRVTEVFQEAFDHQIVPFSWLVDRLGVRRNRTYNPLFQNFFNFQNFIKQSPQGADLVWEAIPVDLHKSHMDLELALRETEQGMEGYLEYNTDLFEPGTAVGLVGQFLEILESGVGMPLA